MAALRMVFDWVVTGHVFDVNPADDVPSMSWKRQESRSQSEPANCWIASPSPKNASKTLLSSERRRSQRLPSAF